MGKLIYLMNVSLDGFVETPDHGLDWGDHRRRAALLVQRPDARRRRLALWPAALRGHGRLLADRRVQPRGDRADASNSPGSGTPRRGSSSRTASSRSTSTADWPRATWARSLRRSRPSSMATSKSADRRSPPSSSSADWSTNTTWSSTRSSSARARRSFLRSIARIGLKLIDTRVFGSGVVYQGYAATHE